MANLRSIRNRIKSVKSTEKITRAMKMVAAAKLRRAQEAAVASTPYQKKIESLLGRLSGKSQDAHPFLVKQESTKRLLIIISSDRGLCGGFNNNLFKAVHKRMTPDTSLLLIGKKASSHFSEKKFSVVKKYPTFWSDYSHKAVKEIFDECSRLFLEKEFGQVDMMFNEFVTVMSQIPTHKTLLPMINEFQDQEQEQTEYKFVPDEVTILQTLIPRSVLTTFYSATLHSLAGEYGARMTAMDSASRNAGEMIDQLTLNMNRVRQAAITSELVEIISGAEAIA